VSVPRKVLGQQTPSTWGLLGALVEVCCPVCDRVHCEASADTRLIRWRCRRCGRWCMWKGDRAA